MSDTLSIWLNKNVVVIKRDNRFRLFGIFMSFDNNFINLQDYNTKKIRTISINNIYDIVDDDKQNNRYRG